MAENDWRLFDYDPVTEKSVFVRMNGDGTATVRTVAPVDQILTENAAIRSATAGQKHGDGLSLAARVPMHIYARQLAEPIAQGDDRYVQKWLNDSDRSAWRTRDGKA